VDEYADGDGLNALRTREADLDKHLVNDREQEGEKARDELEEQLRIVALEKNASRWNTAAATTSSCSRR
jgi:carboxyl-terminal processing protease